jgi:protein-S-isoprenylcysteine O-methyltransferase Ste14
VNIWSQLSGLIPCVAEIAVILATHFPSPPSSTILSTLVHGKLPELTPNRYFILGTILVSIGGLGRMWCFRVMGRHFTHQLTIRKHHALVTEGPYSIVRHPGYAFSWIALSGMSLIYASPGSFVRTSGWLSTYFGRAVLGIWGVQVLLSAVLSRARSISEDAMLRKHFGEEWDRWSKRVPYRLIPGIF